MGFRELQQSIDNLAPELKKLPASDRVLILCFREVASNLDTLAICARELMESLESIDESLKRLADASSKPRD